jgi:hypothetical protein
MAFFHSRLALLAIAIGLLVVLGLPAASLYYEYSAGDSCARCHEIRSEHSSWQTSSHRSVACGACHGEILTFDPGFHLGNVRRLVQHIRGAYRDPIRLRTVDVNVMVGRCQKCHQQEAAQWQNGPHGVTYEKIFLDPKHNHKRLLMDDCLRCHGMFFEGGIRDLVAPLNTEGPWKLLPASVVHQHAVPCLTCHSIHRFGAPLQKEDDDDSKAKFAGREELTRPSLGFFDRRERASFSVALLPLPLMVDSGRPVKISPDPRQALCYQCHAPLASMEVHSGDDRTPVGVHEGLSCLSCHQKHGQHTRASCSTCHPRLSNCGLDVEKMDTTFASTKSPHNIHFVKCQDCHPKGIPKKRNTANPVHSL